MSDKSSTVRVKPYTKELIIKHSRKQKMTQNDLIEKALLVAESVNFESETPLKQIQKMQVQQTNRLIGFLKQQDKNLNQVEENIYSYFQDKLKFERREALEYYHLQGANFVAEAAEEFYKKKNKEEATEIFMERFRNFSYQAYQRLLSELKKDGY